MVLVVSQGFALVLLVAWIAAGAPIEHDAASTAWAAGSGMIGVTALASFYRALAIGTMSIVAPLSATGAAIPVLVGLASGERPSTIQFVGIALGDRRGHPRGARRRGARRGGPPRRPDAVFLALVAAVGFGSFFVGIDQAEQSADVAWVLLAARGPEVLVLLSAFAFHRARPPTDPARGPRSSRSASSTCSRTCCSCSPPAAGC